MTVSTGGANPLLAGLPLLDDLGDLTGKSVLVRTDFNVPLREEADGTRSVADDFRIRAALPTLRALQEQGAHVVVATHLGRPEGAPDPRWDLAPVRARLAELAPGVDLLENLRFDPGECAGDETFVKELVRDRDAFVNDAFGVSHRRHASVVGPPEFLPSAAGYLLQSEIEVLGGMLGRPERPFVAVVGGAKVADKLAVMRSLLDHVDVLVVGGGMAFTFLAAQGHDVGASLVDPDRIGECAELLASGKEIALPVDVVALEAGRPFGSAEDAAGGPAGRLVGNDVPDGWLGLDIGPATVERYSALVAGARTVLWNGPMGVFEDPRFADGTAGVARALADCAGTTVVGGGDSAAALDQLGMTDAVDFVSTGGGASLELLEHGDLPGLEALRRAPNAPAVPDPSGTSR